MKYNKEEVQITVAKTIKNKDFQIIRIINNNLFNSQEEEEDSAKIICDIKNKIEVLKKLLESKKINKNDLKDFDNLITPIKVLFDTKKEVKNKIESEEIRKSLPFANQGEIKVEKGKNEISKELINDY